MRRQRLGTLASDIPVLAMAQIAGAASTYERRFTEESSEAVGQGLDRLGAAETWFEPYAVAYEVMIGVAWRRGDLKALGRFATDAQAHARDQGIAHVEELLEALRIAWTLRAGRSDLIHASLASMTAWASHASVPWRLRDARHVALALWSLTAGDPDTAHRHARTLIEAGRNGRRLRTLTKGRIMQALAFAAQDDREAARGAIETALSLAAPQQACAVFAEEGSPVEALVGLVAADEAAPPGARRQAELVLRASALGRREVSVLNEREARIVGYLGDGASNKLIARRMGLTENTIKFHMKRIFAKLGVTSRRDAARAFSRLSRADPDAP